LASAPQWRGGAVHSTAASGLATICGTGNSCNIRAEDEHDKEKNMTGPGNQPEAPVTITSGLQDWQILQQDKEGMARITIRGTWWTVERRENPQVRVRICREGGFSAITRSHDWTVADTVVDSSVQGDEAGKRGMWHLSVTIPRGGPYRLETTVADADDPVEWRRAGQVVHFFCVGDIWLIAGQSNAAGCGRNPIDDPSEIGVHQFSQRGEWELAAHGRLHHPWLAFAKILKKELSCPIGLIPTAVGGTPLSRWDPGQNGDLFDNMANQVRTAGGLVRGVLWYQGESDAGSGHHPQYKTRFTRFVNGIRELTGNAGLPVITVQLNRLHSGKNGAGWEAIREIQRQISHELEQVFLISAFESVLCDGIHNSSSGNLLIAQRAADTALGGIYGRDIPYLHPECACIKRVDQTTIDLHFENIVTRLDYEYALENAFPFAVSDEEGGVPVAAYELPDHKTFRIELARPLKGRITVTGPPGSCPPHVMPKDINGYRGMLGFTMIA